MITQGVRVTSHCSECGRTMNRDVGQFFDRGTLRWGVEGHCEKCLSGWCEQGSGPAPEYIRQALMQAHGPARVRLSGDLPSLVPVLKALREASSLSLGEARTQATQLAERGLVGTLVEVEILALRLREHAISVIVEPGEPGHTPSVQPTRSIR